MPGRVEHAPASKPSTRKPPTFQPLIGSQEPTPVGVGSCDQSLGFLVTLDEVREEFWEIGAAEL